MLSVNIMQAVTLNIDKSKITTAIHSSVPLSVTTYTLPHDMELYMTAILDVFLEALGQQHMTDYLNYCLTEMLNNAKKANMKRVYFKEQALDITDEQDYNRGMQTFKTETMNNVWYYLKLQKEAGLYIKMMLQCRNKEIKLSVHNNVRMTSFEHERIQLKLRQARQFQSLDEALADVLDSSEGAGLGIVIMVLMLRKLGLDEMHYQVYCTRQETVTQITIPLQQLKTQDINQISQNILDAIENIPQFPENITAIIRLIANPDTKLSDIALHISNDAALAADLLKMVNSASYGLRVPCQSIPEAVKFIGIRGIRNLMYSIGSINNIDYKRNDEGRQLLQHANRVAFFAYNLARNFAGDDCKLVEDSYVCGLLHDMGKMLFLTAYPAISKQVTEISVQRGISMQLLENLYAGVSHGEIGALVAEQWNFPASIITVIRYHHTPAAAPEKQRRLTAFIMLADMIDHYQNNEIDFYQFEPDALALIQVVSEPQLKKLAAKLSDAYEYELTRIHHMHELN